MAGLFGAPRRLPPIDPALGAMMMRESGVGQPLQQQMPTPSPQPKKPAFFGQGGTGRAIAGSLGDALLQMNGASPIYSPSVQHQQAMQRQQQLAQQQRQWGNEDWMARQQWERDNPTPRVNDTVADYDFIRGKLGDEAGNTFLRNRADPPQYRQGPDGQFYRVEVPQAPTAPVGRLTPIEPMGAPSSGGNFMTPAQFQAIVAAKGQAAAEQWARQNNIQVRN